MAKRIPDSPTDPAAVPVASEGILSAEEQAKLASARASHVDAIAQIKDPKTQLNAWLEYLRVGADGLLAAANLYPPAAPFMHFINGIRQNLSRIEGLGTK